MPSHVPPNIPLSLKLFQAPFSAFLFLRAFFRSIYRSPRYLFRWSLSRLLLVSFMRARNTYAAFSTRWYIGPTTGTLVRQWSGKNKVKHHEEYVESKGSDKEVYPDVILHRLDFTNVLRKENDSVVVYIHGGGFVRPIIPKGHLPLVKFICESVGSTKAYVVEYDLSPRQVYPVQHVQVIAAMQSVLKHTSADQIILAGDSAGACLASSILAHLQTPSPHAPVLQLGWSDGKEENKLRGTILISPYTRFHRDIDPKVLPKSMIINQNHDYLWPASDVRFQQLYKPFKGEVWAEPHHEGVKSGYWKDVKSEKVLVIAGEWEVLRDDIVSFGQQIKGDNEGSVDVVVTEKDVHDQCVLDIALGHRKSKMLTVLGKWCQGLKRDL